MINRLAIIPARSGSKRIPNKNIKIFYNKPIISYVINKLINSKLKFEDLVNSANGSPGQLLKNIEIWNELSDEIKDKLDFPLKNNIEILEISKLISEQLEIYQQICLVNFIQIIWWRKTKNNDLIKKLENLKSYLKKNIQPRLAWEITFLKISMDDI